MTTPAPQSSAPSKRHFASDNYSGICPEAWEAMAKANAGHARAYGDDPWTAEAADLLREFFECDCQVFFAFNGTAANSLALAAMCQSYHSVICHDTSHVETDECGAPEFFSNGTKLLQVPGQNGKVDLAAVERTVKRRADIHYPKPRVLTLSQATELGTVYTADEVAAAGELCRRLGLGLHMDGARFSNALVSLDAKPKDLTWQAGVDVLCFGGTKGGMAVGEAIVIFDKAIAVDFDYRCKQAGQLASKMRFLSAPWVGMLRTGAWRKHAAHANRQAKLLAQGMGDIPGVRLMFPTDANAVFAELPPAALEALRDRGWVFYTFIGSGGARFMCSWDTTEEDVQALLADLGDVMAHSDGELRQPAGVGQK